mgnify:FL=1
MSGASLPNVGDKIPEQEVQLRRLDVLRYCGACNDFAGTHWNERVARQVGFPDVISQGTLNAASAVQKIMDSLDSSAEFMEYSVRNFSHPVVVPDDEDGGKFVVSGKVESVEDDIVTIRVYTSRTDAKKVMTGMKVRVRYRN